MGLVLNLISLYMILATTNVLFVLTSRVEIFLLKHWAQIPSTLSDHFNNDGEPFMNNKEQYCNNHLCWIVLILLLMTFYKTSSLTRGFFHTWLIFKIGTLNWWGFLSGKLSRRDNPSNSEYTSTLNIEFNFLQTIYVSDPSAGKSSKQSAFLSFLC